MRRYLLAAALLWGAACGRVDREDAAPVGAAVASPASFSAMSEAATPAVQVCKVAAPLALVDGVTYAGQLYPVMQRSCAQCHRGDIENRQNSTNCYYLRDNIAAVIKRLENAADAAARKAADPTLTEQQLRDAYPQSEWPMPAPGGNRAPLSSDEIALFKAWSERADQCEERDEVAAAPEVTPPPRYSSDEDEAAPDNLAKVLESGAGCEEGPSVNSAENWALVAPALAVPAEATSAFYDYAARGFVAGAEASAFDCTWEAFRAGFGAIGGVAPTLRAYEAHGWRLLACARKDGVPLVGMATLSRVTNTIGDVTLGVHYKTVTIEGAP